MSSRKPRARGRRRRRPVLTAQLHPRVQFLMTEPLSFRDSLLAGADFSTREPGDEAHTAADFACVDVSNASLFDVILTDAQLSPDNGVIMAEHPARPNGRRFRYQRTTLSPDITGADTTCPDGRGGACDAQRLTSRPMPERWNP